jgi:endonuclease VIII
MLAYCSAGGTGFRSYAGAMPEGDTIHKLAARLAPALTDRPVTRIEVTRARSHPKPGTVITAVEAVGKHLLVRFADGHVLRTHLGMSGRWDLYRPGERWRRPRHLARAVIEVPDAVAVCFSAPTVALARAPVDAPVAEVGGVDHLGPDLCRPDADLDAALARMAVIPPPGTPIADVLLDQRVACGIGNVYKSEVLWACRVHPLAPVEAVNEPTRRALLSSAAELLRRNLGPGPRATVEGRGGRGSLAVYGRSRRPCRRCSTPIVSARAGAAARATYWCPRCQPD